MKITSLLLIVAILTGCSIKNDSTVHTEEGEEVPIPDHLADLANLNAWSVETPPAYSISFEKDLTIKDTDNLSLSGLYYVVIDDNNRLFIPGSGRKIFIFSPEGALLDSVGGYGFGPGEFRNFSIMKPVIGNEYLYVYDGTLQRVTLFSLDDFSLESINLMDPWNWRHIESIQGRIPDQWHLHARNDNTLLMSYVKNIQDENGESIRTLAYYQMNNYGEIISDLLFEHPNDFLESGIGPASPMMFSDPRLPSEDGSLLAVSKDGTIYYASANDFLITVIDKDGNYLRTIYYPFQHTPLEPEEIIEHSYQNNPDPERLKEGLDNVDFPDIWPAIADLLVDEKNRLWVATITDDTENYEWWVLEDTGKLLAKFKWPGKRLLRHTENKQILHIKNDYLYTLEKEGDEYPYEESINRYKISFNEISVE